MIKEKNIENLQFAVYGGICGVLGLVTILLLFLSGFDCKSDLVFMIGVSIICAILGFFSIFFGLKAKRHIQGKSVITLGIIVFILIVLIYIFDFSCS